MDAARDEHSEALKGKARRDKAAGTSCGAPCRWCEWWDDGRNAFAQAADWSGGRSAVVPQGTAPRSRYLFLVPALRIHIT
ncbi:hypothetical protein RRF57_002652 [Xylaria bambusicola]|uniref:Uncharacterized protein n=1 Tax=Xylaria bambusicola TaxID=326684 RepID=A0AAN7UFL1_9PEZI